MICRELLHNLSISYVEKLKKSATQLREIFLKFFNCLVSGEKKSQNLPIDHMKNLKVLLISHKKKKNYKIHQLIERKYRETHQSVVEEKLQNSPLDS